MVNETLLEQAEKQAARCRAFGNARRLMILWILSRGELPVHEIAARAGSSLQNVSQHLTLLCRSGIITKRREGQLIYYRLTDQATVKLCPALMRNPERLENNNPSNHLDKENKNDN